MCLGLFICFRTDYSRLHAASAAEVDDLSGVLGVKCSRNVKRLLKDTWKESRGECEMVFVSDLSDLIHFTFPQMWDDYNVLTFNLDGGTFLLLK